jgi:hypothetical protein
MLIQNMPQNGRGKFHKSRTINGIPMNLLLIIQRRLIEFYYKIFSILFFFIQIDLYIDDQLIATNDDNFQVTNDHPLAVIEETKDTIFTLGACWHGKTNNKYFGSHMQG